MKQSQTVGLIFVNLPTYDIHQTTQTAVSSYTYIHVVIFMKSNKKMQIKTLTSNRNVDPLTTRFCAFLKQNPIQLLLHFYKECENDDEAMLFSTSHTQLVTQISLYLSKLKLKKVQKATLIQREIYFFFFNFFPGSMKCIR